MGGLAYRIGSPFGAAAMVGLLLGTGCKTAEEYRLERAEYAVSHFEKALQKELVRNKRYTLPECVGIALKHNLDLKVYQLEEAVARESRTAEMLGMLPELNVTDSLTGRNNIPASSSRKVGESGLSYGASTSQDEDYNYVNVDLVLSVLDFGLAWFNTQQSNDRTLLREQMTRRATQNLAFDVAKAYFQVAAAQRAITISKDLLEQCRNRYELIDRLGRAREITPFRAFDETRRFVEMEKRLTAYIRTYENACYELRSLLGLYPNANIQVDDSVLDTMPDFKLPEITVMEQIALLQRPELYEVDINKHINVIECRKTILMMFPNVRMFVDFTNNNNSFLYHQSWWEIGIRAAYNLLKLPQHIARYRAYSTQVESQEARLWSQAIGVMAQVRIAHANIMAGKERLEIDERVLTAYDRNLNWAEKNYTTTGELSRLELDHIRLSTAETRIDCLIAKSNYLVSYYRMLNTLGVLHLDPETVGNLHKELDSARTRAEKELAAQKTQMQEIVQIPDDYKALGEVNPANPVMAPPPEAK